MSLRNFLAVLFVCTVIPLQAETLTLTLLDESGTPIPQAKFSYWGDPQPRDAPDFRKYTETNENGQYTVEFDPNTQKSLVFIFESPGYAPFHAAWGDKDSNITHDPIPAEYSVKLEKAITIGGVVLDPDGKPLAGASIDFSVPWGKRVRIKQPDYYVCGCRAKTDENGVWKYESVPSDLLDSDVGIMFKHPDYMNTQKRFKSADLVPNAEGTFTQSVQLEQGITITGRVTDIAGNPVVGAIVVGRNTEYGLDNGQAETNENGEYSLKNWGESRDAYVGVWKAGMMSALKSLPAVEKANPPVVNFTLQPAGKPVTFKIVDKNGESIKGFSIAIERWGNHRLVSDILLTGTDNRPETDENGRWTWREAPESEVVFDMFLNENHMDVRGKSVVPRDEEYVFVSGDPLKISGKVTDEETGETIPTFNVYFGRTFSNKDRIYWDIRHGAGGDGAYRVGDNDVKFDVAVKIEADGYETVISRDIQPDEGSITLDFALKKLPPEKAAGIRGTLLAPDGTPATDANVAMATHGNGRPYIMSGRLYQEQEPYTTSTDKEGKFKFAYIDFEQESQQYRGRPDRQKVDYILFFLHGTGFKRITQQEWESLEEDKIVTLEPWGRIEGTVKVGTQPGKNLPLQCGISFDGEGFMYGNEPHMYLQYDTTADDSGRFSFERVPASFVTVSRTIRFHDTGRSHSSTSSHSADKIELKPGETATVALGGVGRPVTGKLEPSAEFAVPPDWTFSYIECAPIPEKIDYPDLTELRKKMMPKELLEAIEVRDYEKLQELYKTWNETEYGKKFQAAVEEMTKDAKAAQERNQAKQVKRRVCAVAKDGTFRLDDIPQGEWRLTVTLEAPPPTMDSCGTGGRIGTLEHRFTVEEIPGGLSDEPTDVGTLEVRQLAQQRPIPQVGETAPEFEILKIKPLATDEEFEESGEKLRLSDYRGKYVILDFWAMWCGPCLAKLPELKKLYEKIRDDERFVLIGISLDPAKSEEKLGRTVARLKIDWLQGWSGDWDSATARTYGINSIPALLLIGPDGKVLLSNPDVAELMKKIEGIQEK